MRRCPVLPLRGCVLVSLLSMLGCDGSGSLAHSIVGTWQGRPETSAERLEREWPTETTAEPPPATETTDLEALAEVRVRLKLSPDGEAELSLDSEEPQQATWQLLPIEGHRALLDLELAAEEETDRERRRFELTFLPGADRSGDRFVLIEEGADPRFGRLIFELTDPQD